LAATNQQVYTFTPRGTVSNVRFSYVNTNGSVITAITGGNAGNNITTAVTATASFNTGLNAPATGLTNANPLTADIYVIYNDGATNNGVDRQMKITPKVKDCACCGAFSYTNADPTQPKVWLEFMCHNIGADESRDPFIYNSAMLGDLYQWGRSTDGHEKRGSDNTTLVATVATPNHDFFIQAAGGFHWTSVSNKEALWGGGVVEPQNTNTAAFNQRKGPNDPCPAGWKVPSSKQWQSLFIGPTAGPNFNGTDVLTTTSPSANVITAVVNPAMTQAGNNGYNFGNLLFLPLAGYRGGLGPVYSGSIGYYHSANVRDAGGTFTNSMELGAFTANGIKFKDDLYQFIGQTVRCVIDK
jgi:uncharacterized protein (TIGR02145 family)